MEGEDWTDGEIDLIVADYFEMLHLDLSGEPYVKAHRNRALQSLTGRSHGSIEFKHQNISAVLSRLGRPWIPGYKPKQNVQKALIEGVARYLASNIDIPEPSKKQIWTVKESQPLFLEPPPKLTAPSEEEPDALARLVRKFDVALKDEKNRRLGRVGEEAVLGWERQKLIMASRADLAQKVTWISEEFGDGAGYDILSYEPDGRERFVEVKTTSGHQTTPFYISENERALSDERPDAFRLIRLYNMYREPRAFELIPPLTSYVTLRPINFRAEFTNSAI
ncbi:MAG: DUF3883 domain-containing protein [Sphingomonadaceae bacterium]